MMTMKHRQFFSGEALTWWLVGATFCVLGIVATVFEIMNHERTRTAAAPYAFHMVPLPKATQAATPPHPHQVKQFAAPRPHAKEAKAPVNASPMHQRESSSPLSAKRKISPVSPHTQFSILTSRQRARLISHYVTYWIEHVEQRASGQLLNQNSGKIKLRVTVVSSGHLAGLALLNSTLPGTESSRAVELIRAASPYAPFPGSLAREANKLIINCTMQFMDGAQSTPASQAKPDNLITHNAGLGENLSQALLGGGS
jgi:protein TonB